MKSDRNTWIRRAGVTLAGMTLAGGLAAMPAFAGGAPTACPVQAAGSQPNTNPTPGDGVPGGDCAVTGTITITTALSFATNITAFSLNGSALNTPSGAGQVQIASNVPTGYYVSESGPAAGFTNSANASTLPDNAVSAATVNGGATMTGTACPSATVGWFPLTAAAFQPLAVSQASGQLNCGTFSGGYTPPTGYDSFNLAGWELTSVNGTPAGTYTGTVQMALWGT